MRRWQTAADVTAFILPTVCFVCFPKVFAPSIAASLKLCAESVIPAVFLFAVLTKYCSYAGITERLGIFLAPVLYKLLYLPPSLCGAVLIGLTAGFPNGANAVRAVYEKCRCTKRQASFAAAVADAASLPFAVSVAGIAVNGDIAVGLLFFAIQTLFGILFLRAAAKRDGVSPAPPLFLSAVPDVSARFCLVRAIADAAGAIVSICGFVLFFGTFGAVLAGMINEPLLKTLVLCVFEITSGLKACASLSSAYRPAVSAFAVGFCSLSGICQTAYVLSEAGLSAKPYIVFRVCSALLLPAVFLLPRTVTVYAVTMAAAALIYGITTARKRKMS